MSLRLSYLPADVFGLSELSRAALAGRPEPPSLPGMRVPASVEHVPAPPELLEPDERAELAETLEARLSELGSHVAVLESVRSLAQPGAACVVAGQQPGFLGGPLYDLYKALHAVRLARALSAAWERPVVPLFWNHADDHDIAEVHHLHVVNPNLDLRKVALPGMSSGKRPFSTLVLDAEAHRLEPIGELLRQILPESAHREEALERFLPRHGETLARAFTRAYGDLLGPLGLVVLEPDWIRTSLSRALAGIVGKDPRGPLERGAEALRAAGHGVAIDPSEAALVFRHVDGKRQALRAGGDGFRYDDEPGSRSCAELAAEIVQDPADWSPGALLRPLVQDLALPVAAYVGGWGELAYHAELPPLRAHVGAPATPFVPRLSATLLDAETRGSLAKLERTVAEALAGAAPEEAEEPEGAPVAADLRAVAADAAGALLAQQGALSELDPGLGVQLKRTSKQLVDLVDKLAGKADRVHANRQGKGKRHQRRIESLLLPRELPQERVLGAVQFTARFGTDWIAELCGEIDPFPSEHLAVELAAEDA
ncbi:MAG: bacillithiol biosynthesis cysteine-adding enzyme BshC [Planctomycetota bacterium]